MNMVFIEEMKYKQTNDNTWQVTICFMNTETTTVRGSVRIAGNCPGNCDKTNAQFNNFIQNLEQSVNQVGAKLLT